MGCTDKAKTGRIRQALQALKADLDPEAYAEVAGAVGTIPGADQAMDDNQNQNQNGAEELKQLKPEVLSRVISFSIPGEGTAESNQNQNQNGGLAALAIEKPDLVLQLGGQR